jgi:hypothetical protein
MRTIRQYLPSLRNAIALCCGALLAFLLWWWMSHSKAASEPQTFTPAGEVDRIEYAVANARSWRVTTTGTQRGQPIQTDQDVVCPFESHTVIRTSSPSGADTVLQESIGTKEMSYVREGDDPWRASPNVESDKCRVGPSAGPASLIDTLERLKAATRLRKGSLLKSEGGSCRVWDFLSLDSYAPVASICVDDLTHLPYELRFGPLRVQYSGWNEPAAIDAPVIR